MSSENVLEVKNLTIDFYTEEEIVHAVIDVSFNLRKGEILGIVGETGSGKSVSTYTLARLIPMPPGKIISGEIWLRTKDGQEVSLLDTPSHLMRKYRGSEIGMIFQEPMTSLNPVMTCGKQVAEAIQLHQKLSYKEAREKAIELFNEVKLPRPAEIFDSYPHQLSGGQKQRVMIAMALSCEPSILVADEPTTALDVTVQKVILDLLCEIQARRGMSVIFISHDLGVIASISDRVMVMKDGRKVEEGDILTIFTNPREAYTRGLIASRPPLSRRLHFLPSVKDFLPSPADGKMKTIEEVIRGLEVKVHERKARHERIYSQEPLISVRNLKVYFPIKGGWLGRVKGYVKAVDDVSFDIYPGETLGLVGESGSGKTTLGQALIKLIDSTGEIYYKKRDVNKFTKRELRMWRKNVQIIFQDPYSSLNPRLTVGEAIMEPMRIHKILENDKERKERAMELLKRVGLEESHFYRYPHEFSGGQRQRICIARAIASNPEFIVCDECVSSLDVSVQAQVLNLLKELQNEFNLTYLFISHDFSVVKFMSDRIMVMHMGKIVEEKEADELFQNPQEEYTKQLISAIPSTDIEVIKKNIERRNRMRSFFSVSV